VTEFVGPFRVEFADPLSLSDAGPLAGLTVAVKDVVDVAGVKTGAGNPAFLDDASPASEHAAAVAALLAAGAAAVGKAHTDEFAYSLSGTNAHYGTPLNAAAPGRVPGGSSSGPASAVCSGLADIGLGTDTAGSIRVPASYCGVYGLRPTHGRVPVRGVVPLAPSFDTCGVLAADGALLERAALVALSSSSPSPSPPGPADPPEALVLGSDLFAEADPGVTDALRAAAERLAAALGVALEVAEFAGGRLPTWLDAFVRRQRVEAWRGLGPWIETHEPALGPGIRARFEAARATPESNALGADRVHVEVLEALESALPAGAALVLPATATPAPVPERSAADKDDLRTRTMSLTTIAGLAGAPAVSLPLGRVDDLPVGLSLLGRPGDDERLLAAARLAGGLAA
jgi:Asp-tRNA(Asn)/Glu-tRNA(Gln) amidotransferase A subunit family amidase